MNVHMQLSARFFLLVHVLLVLSFCVIARSQFSCTFSPPCKLSSPCLPNQKVDYTVTFDLTGVTRATDYIFKDISSGYNYYTNVCGYNNATCESQTVLAVGIVENAVSANDCYVMATVQSSTALIDPANAQTGVVISYVYGDPQGCSSGRRSMTQILRCNPSVDSPYISSVTSTASTCAYTINFQSKLACPTLTPINPPPSTSSSLSGGSIFLIVFFVGSFAYVFLGSLYNYAQGRRGADMCVHRQFWCETLPQLVKEGFAFVLWKSGCSNSQGNCMEKSEEYAVIRDKHESNRNANTAQTPTQTAKHQQIQQEETKAGLVSAPPPLHPPTPHGALLTPEPFPTTTRTPTHSTSAGSVERRTSDRSTMPANLPLPSPTNRPEYFPPLPSMTPTAASAFTSTRPAGLAATASFANYGGVASDAVVVPTPKGIRPTPKSTPKGSSNNTEKRVSISVERQPYE